MTSSINELSFSRAKAIESDTFIIIEVNAHVELQGSEGIVEVEPSKVEII